MKRFAIYEEAKSGRIWARFADIDGIVGEGATIDEARASLLESIRLAVESGEQIEPDSTIAVEQLDFELSA